MRRVAAWIAVLATGLMAPVAHAQDEAGSADTAQTRQGPYMTVLPFYPSPDDDRGADDYGFGVGVGGGWHLQNGLDLEYQAFANTIETDAGPQTDFYQYGLGLDLRYRFIHGTGFSPFILAGVGAVHDDVLPDFEDSTNAFANAGLGFVTGELGDLALRIRGEVRYIYDDFDYGTESGMSDYRASLGFEIPLGSRVVEKTIVREKEVVRTVSQPVQDSDGDGVPDRNDRCADTLEGLRVDNRGCAERDQTIRLEGVHFALDSAQLRPDARRNLADVVDAMRGQPDLEVVIAGHTDSQGASDYNRGLSRERAASVRSFLIGQSIDPDRLRAVGYGESRPIASNDTEHGRARNRRVEFQVIE